LATLATPTIRLLHTQYEKSKQSPVYGVFLTVTSTFLYQS